MVDVELNESCGTFEVELTNDNTVNVEVTVGCGITKFIDLIDTPTTYVGQGGKFIKVNTGETAVEFVTSSASTSWGDIIGTLSNQTDLQNNLNSKLDSVVAGTNITVDITDPNNPIINATDAQGVTSVNGDSGPAVTLDTDDIADTATNRYTTDTDITRLANTSGINTGDQVGSDFAIGDLTGNMDDIDNGITYVKTENNFTDTQVTILSNTSGTNTGDQDLSGYQPLDIVLTNTTASFTTALEDEIDTNSDKISFDLTSSTRLANTSGTNTGDQDLSSLALKSNVLELDNTTVFTPDSDYEPATKKYVDDNSGGSGDVTGPASSTDDNIVLFDGTTGKIIKDSGLTISGTNTGDVTVTDSSEINFTLTGQDITASIVSGSVDETKLDTSVNASLDLADSALQSYTETDPIFLASQAYNIDSTDITNLSNLSGTNSGDNAVNTLYSSLISYPGSASATELNILDGATLTTEELNYVDGVTSNIQTQLNAKLGLSGGTMTGDINMGNNDIPSVKTITANSEVTDTFATTKTIDFSTGSKRTITLTGNTTITFSAGGISNANLLRVVQDATGSRVITFANLKSGLTAPEILTTASSTTYLAVYYDGTNYVVQSLKVE
jgi:hypothetical protein